MKSFARLTRPLMALAFALLLAVGPVAPLGAQVAGAASPPWQLTVGASSPDQAVQVNFFIPRQIWIHVNDKVTWTWKSGEIHTVSFLSGQPPSFPGAPFAPAGGSPFAAVYGGSGQVSSGIHSALESTPAPTYTVTFTKTGDYQFNCLVHAPMTGVVHVRPLGQALPHDQAFYTQQAQAGAARLLNEGAEVQAEGAAIATAAGPTQVNAGYGEEEDTGSFAILRFQPQQLWVKVNDTVTFTNRDPATPHTVTFGVETNPDFLISPGGTPAILGAGFNPAVNTINSGIISQISFAPFFTFRGPTFKVKFTAAGDYKYRCELHDDLGMVGTIHVR